ncbi:hypothetical protein ANCCEY_03278 [Ancylostoma ceylanicum]|uniref:SLED domain-containing protein n=1 Tax=Ancylostoma ceylanicum TaxID=53326 RepID=A0A0D6M5B8_9BILA|nr:hypothetical protein ANCCEY_03278 [Ancylostoma ceylanicum]
MLLNSCLLERITGDKAKFMKLASYGLQVDHEKSGIQRGMPDWSTVTPRLEYDKIFSPPRPESFNWKDYFAATGTNPCTDEVLFGHVRYLEQTVSERLFEHGKHIFVKTENDNERVARIEVCCKGKLLVNYLNIDDKERKEDVDGEITVDDVVTNTSEVEQSIKRVLAEEKEKRRKWDFLDVEQIAKYRDVLDHRLNDLIEEGQYFELQDAVEPRCVFCCRVLVNLGGIVIYEALDYTMSINITDPRCHPIGWAASHQEDSVAYCPGKYSVESIKKFAKNSVPAIVFKRYELKEHTLKVGCLVEVQDAEQRAAIFPGHVSEIINSHFVKIVSFSYGRSETREIPTSEYSFEPIPGRESKITPMRHIEALLGSTFFDMDTLRSLVTYGSLESMYILLVESGRGLFDLSLQRSLNIYQCASLEHRMDVQAILNTDDEDVAVIHVKFKWRTSPDHVLMRVPVCRTARQAAGWLRVLLRSLGCCPHLFSFEKAPKCTCTKITPEERRRSPLRPLRIDGDIMEWDANQLIGFLRTTFPDISDVTNVLEKEEIKSANESHL